MKKILLTLSILSLITSCKDDFVDIKQEGVTVGTDFFQTQEDAMKATNAIYSFLRSWENTGFPAQNILQNFRAQGRGAGILQEVERMRQI